MIRNSSDHLLGSVLQRDDSGLETKESMISMRQDFTRVKQACEARKNNIIINKRAFLNGDDSARQVRNDNNIVVVQSVPAVNGETFRTFTSVDEPAKFVYQQSLSSLSKELKVTKVLRFDQPSPQKSVALEKRGQNDC